MASPLLASTSPLLALAALACPVGMGAMMWFMARGARSKSSPPPAQDASTLEDLRREHERLGTQIENLQGPHVDAERVEAAEPAARYRPLGATAAGTRDTLE
jgi:hypothetical protein